MIGTLGKAAAYWNSFIVRQITSALTSFGRSRPN